MNHPTLRPDTPGHAAAATPLTGMGSHTAAPNQLPTPGAVSHSPRGAEPSGRRSPGTARY